MAMMRRREVVTIKREVVVVVTMEVVLVRMMMMMTMVVRMVTRSKVREAITVLPAVARPTESITVANRFQRKVIF